MWKRKQKVKASLIASTLVFDLDSEFPLNEVDGEVFVREDMHLLTSNEWAILQFYILTITAQHAFPDRRNAILIQRALHEAFILKHPALESRIRESIQLYARSAMLADPNEIAPNLALSFCQISMIEEVGIQDDGRLLLAITSLVESDFAARAEFWQKMSKSCRIV